MPESSTVSTGSAGSMVTRPAAGRAPPNVLSVRPGTNSVVEADQLSPVPGSTSRTTRVTGAGKRIVRQGLPLSAMPFRPVAVSAVVPIAGRSSTVVGAGVRRSTGPSAKDVGSVVSRGIVWNPCSDSSRSRRRKRPITR